jgi:predicted acylesterase/phospholipase RssA
LKLTQQHALCTYKDPDVPPHVALTRALEILESDADLLTTTNQETLGLAGAIFKHRFETDGIKQHLETSLDYYRRGWALGPAGDQGYTGINAAFVLDMLAHLEEEMARKSGIASEVAVARRRQAREIRESLIEVLGDNPALQAYRGEWWFTATLAEAHFGLGPNDFPEAGKSPAEVSAAEQEEIVERWQDVVGHDAFGKGELHYSKAYSLLTNHALADDRTIRPWAWEFESTARQLASLALLQRWPVEIEKTPAWETICLFLGPEEQESLRSVFYGKLGIGLSGGGFRASLFHLGVLAKLAELDLLRHVNVLSCVSGGSIVGAHYYLKVRQLLQRKVDAEIDRSDYIKLVEEMIDEFKAGVQENLRTRVIGNLVGNLKMVFDSAYSRTERLGELFEKHIYRRIKGEDGQPITDDLTMDQLRIQPKQAEAEGQPAGNRPFTPRRDNWRRRNKVPMLVLNATSLNTGHNWQFTTSFMGESPFAVDEEIDGNWRFRRLYYSNAPEGLTKVPLGMAVGASACVPGLFEPIALPNLYPKNTKDYPEMTVRLVDGGVHDNQGLVSLLEQSCSVLVCSDASGQMTSDADPSRGILGPLLRTNSALMERVRQAQFDDLKARKRSGLLKGLMILHAKKDFVVEPIDWKTCEEPVDQPLRRGAELLPYGVTKEMQEMLAAVRTDLDSFSDIEAYALMTSGYLMTERYARDLAPFPMCAESAVDWAFLDLAESLRSLGPDPESRTLHDRVKENLRSSAKGAFRAWGISPGLQLIAKVLGISGALAALYLLWHFRALVLLHVTIGQVLLVIVVLAAPFVLGGFVAKVLRSPQTLYRVVFGLVLSVLGGIASQLHLRIFDRMFLKMGRVARKAKS